MANLIRYKNKVTFDYFSVWCGENEYYEYEDFEETKATCVSTQICPWCVKKYGLSISHP